MPASDTRGSGSQVPLFVPIAVWGFPLSPPLLELSLHNLPSRPLETCAGFFYPRMEE